MKLFVGNLSWGATEEDVRQLFGQYGEIVSVKIITDQTGRSRGFCFVEMASKEAGDAAIRGLDNAELAGRQIRVSEARNDSNRGGGPRGGGGGGGDRRSFGSKYGSGYSEGNSGRYQSFHNSATASE